jgi:hypothetical protein
MVMHDGTTTIAGIEIPSTNPLFLTIIAVHVLLGLICVIAGAVAMLSGKRPGRHPKFGTIYYWSLATLVLTASILSFMRWEENYHLFMLGILTFFAATVGRAARRTDWPRWAKLHVAGMGSAYILMLTAFYVDNGRQLPVWKELPHWTYWTLPALFGVPLMIWAAIRRVPVAVRKAIQLPS